MTDPIVLPPLEIQDAKRSLTMTNALKAGTTWYNSECDPNGF